jgi:hypothetical protein
MSENEIRNSMASAARQSVMKYNWSSTAQHLFQMYQELLGQLTKQ